MATAFDTLATYDAIAASGLDEKSARAISKAIADSASVYRADLATKTDIAEVRSDLAELRLLTKSDLAELKLLTKTDIDRFDFKLETKIAEVKELIASTQNKTLVWMFGMLVTFSGIIIGVIKLA